MLNNFRDKVISFIESKSDFPTISAIAAGLYPLIYYYERNFTLVNSWEHFVYFLVFFILMPILIFKIIYAITKRFYFFKPIRKLVLPILNMSWSFYLVTHITFKFNFEIILIGILVAVIVSFFLYKHFKKLIVFQFLLAFFVFILLLKYLITNTKYNNLWLNQPDDIEEVVFKKKPNIFFIQPDGYANISELGKGYYQFDNSNFETYLNNNDFKVYSNYRSNYSSTLSSNSSLFAMKHHYYKSPINKIREVFGARDVIIGENPVLKIFKNNNYRTHLLLGNSYLLANRPNIYYDYCNIDYSEFDYFSRGFEMSKDIKSELKSRILTHKKSNNFFFLERLSPHHIKNKKKSDNDAGKEREKYLIRLTETNKWLREVIDYITINDKNSMIVIAADHGGYVGMNAVIESREKQSDRNLIYSIFTSQLAVKWPEEVPHYENKIKTPVNLFRIIFSYLSEDERYLSHLQDDKSYIQIDKGAPIGVYEYIDKKGNILFNKHLD